MGAWAQVVYWLWRCFVGFCWQLGTARIGSLESGGLAARRADFSSSAPARFAVTASRDLVFGLYCCGFSVAAGLCRRGACDASTLQGFKRGSPTLHQCWCYVRLHIHTAAAPRLLQDIVCWSLGHFPALFGCSSFPLGLALSSFAPPCPGFCLHVSDTHLPLCVSSGHTKQVCVLRSPAMPLLLSMHAVLSCKH
jgi:hypothetical protein